MVSVLLTTYNSAKYISYSIQSVLNQTYENFELLIIDDGSTDNTEEVVNSFVNNKINYKKIQHIGRSRALNYGLNVCKYDLVALIDADDIAHPKRLELQLQTKLKYNSIVISGSVNFEKEEIIFKIDVSRIIFPKDLILHQKFPNSVLYNRKYIIENGGYNEDIKIAEDYELWLRLKDKADFIIVNKVLMFIRNTPNSLSRANAKLTNSMIYKIQKIYYENLEEDFGIVKTTEQNSFYGWREYFFGNPKLARKYWRNSGIYIFKPRILFAFVITYLPNKYIEKFKESRIKLKLRNLLNKNTKQGTEINNDFRIILKELDENP